MYVYAAAPAKSQEHCLVTCDGAPLMEDACKLCIAVSAHLL